MVLKFLAVSEGSERKSDFGITGILFSHDRIRPVIMIIIVIRVKTCNLFD